MIKSELIEQYMLEKKLSCRLRVANKLERAYLYGSVYNELFQRFPHLVEINTQQREKAVHNETQLLKRFLNRKDTFLEIGAGDCKVSQEVAKYVAKVYAVEVTKEAVKNAVFPNNLSLIIYDGCNLSLPKTHVNVNIAFSSNVAEHLHPEDFFDQVKTVYNLLTKDGLFVCITPNRLSGPHDISKFFDDEATGLHLKEYTVGEMVSIFTSVGFSTIHIYVIAKGIISKFPYSITRAVEYVLCRCPTYLRKFSRKPPLSLMLGIIIVGQK